MPGTPEAFNQWEEDQPPLIETGLGGEYPPGFESVPAARGVPEPEFRQAVCCTTEVIYGSFYCASDESGSRQFVSELANLVGPLGVPFPDPRQFSGSRWSDRHG